MNTNIEIGTYMQRARWDSNKSQEYVAIEMGIARKTVQNWENGISTPSLCQFKQWFNVLNLNPMPYIYMYFYQNQDEDRTNDDKELREQLINIIQDIPTQSIKQFLYVMNGTHGSSAKALLQMMIAHIQTPMRDRYHQAASIYNNYELAREMNELTDENAVQPDVEFLKKAICEGRKSVLTGNYEYSML